jgi:alkanesulfonate monooxygenase
LGAAGDGVRADDRLWTAVAKEIGGRSNSTALVGTPEQVAQTLAEYHAIGVTTFLIRGFDPLEDALDYGRVLIPATRELTRRERAAA